MKKRTTRRTRPRSTKPAAGEPTERTRAEATRRAPRRAAKPKRDLTRAYSRAQFAAKLRRLADAIESGRPFTIAVAGESLRIPANATFNVEHERSGGDEELEFQLLWTTTRD